MGSPIRKRYITDGSGPTRFEICMGQLEKMRAKAERTKKRTQSTARCRAFKSQKDHHLEAMWGKRAQP